MKRHALFCFTFVLISVFFALPVRADRVFLSDGRVIEGTVIDEGNRIKIVISGGATWYDRREVLKIEASGQPADDYLKKTAALKDDDIDGRLELAAWCRQNGLTKEWKEELQKILELDPDNEKAHNELGETRYNGTWMTAVQANKARGLVEYDGDWITAEEKLLREALNEKERLKKDLEKKIQALVQLLSSANQDERNDARAKLLSIPFEDKSAVYIKNLQNKNEDTRRFVLDEILVDPPRESILPLVQFALTDSSEILRTRALEGLQAAEGLSETAGKSAATFLSHRDYAVRLRAEQMLSVFPYKPAVPVLIGLLESTIAQKGTEITYYETGPNGPISAIGIKTGEESLDEDVRKQLNEQRKQEQKYILDALKKITGVNFGVDTGRWRNWYSVMESVK